MIFKKLKSGDIVLDHEFDTIYPLNIQALSDRHWTPMMVAKLVSTFLCNENQLKILDIGSGAGKFCFIGAVLKPDCTFYGVDYRDSFIKLSNSLKKKYKIKNTEFINKNILEIDFNNYDGLYFFNSFLEKIDKSAEIDNSVQISYQLYVKYSQHLFNQLANMPTGTRIATYHTANFHIPNNFKIVQEFYHGLLKFYIKCDDVSSDFFYAEQKIIQYISSYVD